jgi:hypothetical protein
MSEPEVQVVTQEQYEEMTPKPWEKFKNPKVRREQEFLQTANTMIGARVEMSDRIYEVTKAGWRKL